MLLEKLITEITAAGNISGPATNFLGIKRTPIKRMKLKGSKKKKKKQAKKDSKPKNSKK